MASWLMVAGLLWSRVSLRREFVKFRERGKLVCLNI